MQVILDKLKNELKLSAAELRFLLETEDEAVPARIFREAYRIKLNRVGGKVFFRGIIEFSNRCAKDCFYCGIRKSNKKVVRFRMTEDEIVNTGHWAWRNRYGSIVLQGGEIESPEYAAFVERVITRLKTETGGGLGITLSLGEQTPEVYERWFKAGAHRYLLRIETSNEQLYRQLHPADHSFRRRLECLRTIRNIGYQTGTGVMIGLPGQTVDDMVNDLLFFEREDIDMLGMGPYIIHRDTPLAKLAGEFDREKQFQLGLKMIAAARIYLRDVNIAATTALQALNPEGRELGLQAGANIIMPNITAVAYRPAYQLYEGKPGLNESSGLCRDRLQNRIENIRETIGYDEWGDSKHFFSRTKAIRSE
ncbi:MAG: [FeFe] hydrogenase H-cluster radical SAM maturase HydE [Victivallaceae bacterium]|nr:[FeFe] hydrogenase H-cluster radical SAM maturase HydE [Victivallaceae bacterium]